MDNLLEFAERLKELMIENEISQSQLAKILNVKDSTVSRYLSGQKIPKLEIFIRLADYFKCYVEFLAGRCEVISNENVKFKKCPPFSVQYKFLLEHFNISRYKLQQDTQISKSVLRYWENGKTQPTIENLIKLAKRFDCSLDFIIGRVDYE